MKRFTGHKEAWGDFVDVKVNAPSLLKNEIRKKRKGRIWISGICDPYQPLEKKYGLTRSCLEIVAEHNWPVTIQTKSPLILRDMELLRGFDQLEAGMTITTADEIIRAAFEPNAPPVEQRIEALDELHSEGIKTFVMIAPVLPGVEGLVLQLSGKVDNVLIDKMNYHYADRVYKKNDLEYARSDSFFTSKKLKLAEAFKKVGITYRFLF
jgi:DNA repair photolyase